MIYEVKSSAASNARCLFSNDLKYFYWNSHKFKNLSLGDYVFIVDRYNHNLIFGRFDKVSIPVVVDKDISVFNDYDKLFSVEGVWESFIRVQIIELIKLSNDWVWQTFGSSETAYLNGSRVGLDGGHNRIKNINQLLPLSKNSEFINVLQNCRGNFNMDVIKIPVVKEVMEVINKDLDNDRKLFYQVVDSSLEFRTLSIFKHEGNFEYEVSSSQEELVYVILDPARNTIKIGKTDRFLDKRLNEHRTSNPHISLLHVFPSSQYSESYLHKMFEDLHDDREWFFYGKKAKEFILKEKTKHQSIIDSYQLKIELNKLESLMLSNFR